VGGGGAAVEGVDGPGVAGACGGVDGRGGGEAGGAGLAGEAGHRVAGYYRALLAGHELLSLAAVRRAALMNSCGGR
jgi:hypothetical protein